jgi:alpha-2-macroglobulin
VTPHGIAGTNEVTLEVSSIRPMNLERRLDYLIRYPHGCVEQTTSSVFPQLYLSTLVKLDEQKKRDIDANIRAGIDRLRLFQIAGGGFTYWPGSPANLYNDWASNYAGHFLVQADKLGYPVPPQMLNDWIAHQKNLAQAWKPEGGDSMMEQAYRLYTLAEVNQPALGAMNRLRETPGLATVVRWQLAAAYKLAGHRDAAEQLVRGVQAEAGDYADPGPTFGSKLRDRAIILNSLIVLGDINHAGPVARSISEELASGHWYSTQSVAYALMAMGRLAGADKQGDVIVFEQSVGSAALKAVRSDKPIYTAKLAGFPDAGDTLRVHNTSDKPIFVQVTTKGASAAGEEKAASAGLRLEVKYTDKAGNAIAPDQLDQGADYVATVMVTNLGERKLDNLALAHIVPSGWELHNARLGSVQAKAPEGIDYQDIRDDRVLSYFTIGAHETKTVEVSFNAAYQGSYYLPAVSVEAMYDATKHAQSRGQWVKVVKSAR